MSEAPTTPEMNTADISDMPKAKNKQEKENLTKLNWIQEPFLAHQNILDFFSFVGNIKSGTA